MIEELQVSSWSFNAVCLVAVWRFVSKLMCKIMHIWHSVVSFVLVEITRRHDAVMVLFRHLFVHVHPLPPLLSIEVIDGRILSIYCKIGGRTK